MLKRLPGSILIGQLSVLLLMAVGHPCQGRADPLSITRWTVDGGGSGWAQSGAIMMAGTIGQPDAGPLPGLAFSIAGGFWIPSTPPVAVDDGPGPGPQPAAFQLIIHPASPNPLLTDTRIEFELPDERECTVQIYDVRGALLRTVASGRFAPGPHQCQWDGRDLNGHPAGAGVYFIRVRLGALERTQKLLVLR